MRLAEVMPQATGQLAGHENPEVRDLVYDSRRAVPGALFFCVVGYRSDGHDHAEEAVARGAAALVVERPLGLGVPEIRVPSARAAMAPAAARFYGDPTATLRVAGITGTNGKTTSAFLIRALVQAGGLHCSLLGTVKSVIGGVEHEVQRTTPEAIDLQGSFRAMLDAGDEACAMEVSSHALQLGRAEAIHFAAAVFTNLTQDHLDFHSSMEDYFQAKRRLFEGPDAAIINVDDAYGRRLAGEHSTALTFAIDRPAAYRATDVHSSFDGCRFTLESPEGRRALTLPLPGRFNVSNALAAIATAHALGVDITTIAAALERVEPIPGRFQPVHEGQDFAVLVDYAHTPDSLKNVLRAARELTAARVICVFGCGGDRDRGKRPLMGAIASELADATIVTSDNPRSEEPQAIIEEILTGIGAEAADPEKRADVRSVIDRRTAIESAVGDARAGDVVVIAGKGHEQGQEFADGYKLAFDDAAVAADALRGRPGAGGRGVHA